jgi:transposase
MRPYSLDLRERILAAVDHHDGSIRWLARIFRVSTSFIVRLLQRRRATGTLAPEPHRGGPPRPSDRATWSGWPPGSASSPTRRWSN